VPSVLAFPSKSKVITGTLAAALFIQGEVGLNGEIRAVNRIEQRIAEAEKLGFEKIFVSKYNKKSFNPSGYKIQIIAVAQVHEVYQALF
jgi:DNA repair protein RadA/Sms